EAIVPGTLGKASGSLHVFVALIANTIFFIAQSGVWAFLERMAAQAGLAHETVGTMLAISVSLAIAGPLAASLIADRYGRAVPLAVVAVGQLAALWILQGPMTAVLFLIAATGFQIFWNFAIPYIVAIVATLDRGRRYIVLVTPFQAAGIALGPVLAGTLAGEGELSLVATLGSAAVLASVVLLFPYALRYRGGRTQAEKEEPQSGREASD
ncbi:MAG: MFS transporter, partial [Gammaproteobacteria bacterium]|nr:MFS transporter [Gammaproteobacteria bacterium]